MVLMLRSKKASRYGAIRCLDFATTRCATACERLVDQNALGLLFALFMAKAKVRRTLDACMHLHIHSMMHACTLSM